MRLPASADPLSVGRFRAASKPERHPIASDVHTQFNALIQLEVACRIALDALPELTHETERTLRDPIQELCDVTGAELDRISPGWRTAMSNPGA